MSDRRIVYVQRGGSLPGRVFAWVVLVTLAAGFMGMFFAWPYNVWTGTTAAVAEGLWLAFLAVIGILVLRGAMRREAARTAPARGRHAGESPRHARPGAHGQPIKPAPGPRDYEVPADQILPGPWERREF